MKNVSDYFFLIYFIPIINEKSIDKSLEYAKGDILNTLINISNNFIKFKAAIVIEAHLNRIESEPIEIGRDEISKYDIDIMIIDIWYKYEQELLHIKNVYTYSANLINTCGLY